MANPRESFPVLESADGSGVVLRQAQVGDDAIAAKNGLIGFSFRDSDDKLVLPKLSPQGALYVDSNTAGSAVWVRGKVTPTLVGDAAAAAPSEVLTYVLTNNKIYTQLSLNVASRRDAYFQLVLDNGTTKMVLTDVIVGPGQYTVAFESTHFYLQAPASGTNSLKVLAYNFEKASDLMATFACVAAA